MKVCFVFCLALMTTSSFVCVDAAYEAIRIKDLPLRKDCAVGRIANGEQALEGEIPYIVALHFSGDSWSWHCGGSIIAHEWILTAAHCTDKANKATISYGTTDLKKPLLEIVASQSSFYKHPKFRGLKNDIALIRTPHIAFNEQIKSITLPTRRPVPDDYNRALAFASGWGETVPSKGVSRRLNKADVNVITNAKCARYYGNVVNEGVLCVQSPDAKSTCSGDSGGPLAFANGNATRPILIGVTSFGSANGCDLGLPTGFARVTTFLKWIRKVSGVV